MAGRGTDIILGGNPEGLTQLCLLRLLYSRLLPGTSPDAASIPHLPLEVFDAYDQQEVERIGVRSVEEVRVGLPRNLHLALLGAILLMTTHVEAAKEER
jgi:preprotein translocase subunit SecA